MNFVPALRAFGHRWVGAGALGLHGFWPHLALPHHSFFSGFVFRTLVELRSCPSRLWAQMGRSRSSRPTWVLATSLTTRSFGFSCVVFSRGVGELRSCPSSLWALRGRSGSSRPTWVLATSCVATSYVFSRLCFFRHFSDITAQKPTSIFLE